MSQAAPVRCDWLSSSLQASRMGRRRSVMRSLGQGLGNLVKTLSRAISGIGSTFSRSISRISQDELDEALGDT